MASVMTSESLMRAGRPVFGGSEEHSSSHQSSTSTYNETKKESRSTMRHHPLERVWCSIKSGLLLCCPELHISRLRGGEGEQKCVGTTPQRGLRRASSPPTQTKRPKTCSLAPPTRGPS